MHVLSAAEMQACDRTTTERFGIPSIQLMRAASAAVAAFARAHFAGARRVTVICGKGNNGGDGMMAARLMADAGLDVTTMLLGDPEQLRGDALAAWNELKAAGKSKVRVVREARELAGLHAELEADLIVDAVLGTGFKPPMKGLALAACEWLQQSHAPVLAVDLPSGWPADETSATVAGAVLHPSDPGSPSHPPPGAPVFPADAVVTFTAPKCAHVFGQLSRVWDQPVVVAPIGSPDAAVISKLKLSWAGSSMKLAQTPRAAAANKGNFGHVLVVGGTFGTAGGKAGAPAMTALAAMRAGAGLVTAAVPAPALAVVASFAPELMTIPLAVTRAGQVAAKNLEKKQVAALIEGKTVLAIGPGLGQGTETAKFVTGLLAATEIPAVIDADALNILAAKPALLKKMAKGRTVVLTPHPGEMARLAGTTVAKVQASRLDMARDYAERMGVTLVLKGARTLIAHPDGRVAVNTSGNPGMAKGGSGDLLTGLIAGLLAQYPNDVAHAVEAAVYLHGLAADLAVRGGDEHTLLATDLLAHLARAFQSCEYNFEVDGKTGYVCLQGIACSSPKSMQQPKESQLNSPLEVQR